MKMFFMILITALSYMLIPIIIILVKKNWSKKKRMYFSIIFCICISLIYQVIGYYSYSDYRINLGPAYLYGSLLLIFNSFIEEKITRKNEIQNSETRQDFTEKNSHSNGTKSYFKDMKLCENDTSLKNINYHNRDNNITNKHIIKLKPKKTLLIFLLLSLILNIVLIIAITFLYNENNKSTKNNMKLEKSVSNLKKEIKDNNNNSNCIYWPVGGVSKVMISAQSSAGVGDVFSRMDSNLQYRITDNNIGDIYNVIMKYQGDESIYECNEAWYLIRLSNGKYGYIWGGYKAMYVREQ